MTGHTHRKGICWCSFDYCIDPNNRGPIFNGQGMCISCESQGRAWTYNDGCSRQYCEITFRSLLPLCHNSGAVRECVKCYGKAAEANKEVSSICPGLIGSNYTLLHIHEDTSQDVYDGTVDNNTD